jgi:hypothetical protein
VGDALAGEHRCMNECDYDARQGCADGYTCMFAGGGFQRDICSNDVCRPLCATDADCDSGQICIIPDTTVPEPHVGFCDIPSCPDPDDGE